MVATNTSSSIAKSAFLVTAMMLAFKLLAFVKQAVIAYFFGATVETDTYFIAWGFISGISEAIVYALLVSLVAIYTQLRLTRKKEEADRLVNGLLEILLPAFAVGTAVICFAAPWLSMILAPSYGGSSRTLLISFTQILSPVLIFGALEFVLSAVMDSHKSFYIPRLQSLIYSLSVIAACFILVKPLGVNALVAAQYFSNICFAILLIAAVRKYHRFSTVKISKIPELKNVLMTAIPLFIGNSALQINQMVDRSITSSLQGGATSALSYCHTLEQFVTNIMIVNIGNVMFANFAGFVAQKEEQKIEQTLAKAINVLIIILTAVSVITIVSARDIVSIVYYRGCFSRKAVDLTALALIGYALSFVAVAVRDLSVKSLYAFKDTKSPVVACTICIAVNIMLSIILSRYLGIIGVSAATSISAVLGMVLNARSLTMYLKNYRYTNHLYTFLKCCPAAILLGAIGYAMQELLPSFGPVSRFSLIAVFGFAAYFVVLKIQGLQELREISDLIRNKLSGTKVENKG